jgi:hypothetical protein
MYAVNVHSTFLLTMTPYKKPRPRDSAVREPIQVYLATPDRKLLDRVAEKTGISRAEVLRRGIRRVAAEVLLNENPMLAFMDEMHAAKWPANTPTDVARRHDHYLAEIYAAKSRKSVKPSSRKRGRRTR